MTSATCDLPYYVFGLVLGLTVALLVVNGLAAVALIDRAIYFDWFQMRRERNFYRDLWKNAKKPQRVQH